MSTIILPRAKDIYLSKYLTRKLTTCGVPTSTLLNTQLSAPLFTQIWSGVGTFMFRMLVFGFIAVLSISYKFSFVRVAAEGIVSIDDQSDSAFGLLSQNLASRSPVSDNVNDVLGRTRSSYLVLTSNSSAGNTELAFGPSFNSTAGRAVTEGTVYDCSAFSTLYSRTTITTSDSSWADTSPIIPQAPSNTSVRFINPADNSLVDISSLDGDIEALFGYPGNDSLGNIQYSAKMSARMRLCDGLISWSSVPTLSYDSRWFFNAPEDFECADEPFNLTF